ncbi:short-chain dehydrogenase [Coprinopsis marcescibilis]|uniref:Short-chain dehydrogenase n=1 Tax=Coprinopsis marcescibilis TaxID=230819 RepID=A0A5C3KXV3_COPMA|nr:short-chain dehydrogenase [Coprinopsis marcescibilis]
MQPTLVYHYRAHSNHPPVVTADLSGKTVVVTGGNSGIGLHTAKHFATMNPGKLIIACRSEEKGRAAAAEIQQETGFERTEVRILDLAKFSSVREFADKFEKEEERLDILVANAGVALFDRRITADGWEETLQVNALSTLLNCITLLPVMIKTYQSNPGVHPRIITVTSTTHYDVRLDNEIVDSPNPLRTLSEAESINMTQRYSESKLFAIFIARSLANVLEKTPIIATSVDPGFCSGSDIFREYNAVARFFMRLMSFVIGHTSEQGSRRLVWAALQEDTDSLRGGFVGPVKVVEPSDYAVSEEGVRAQARLWENFIEELSKVDPKIPEILKSVKVASQ